MFEEGVGKWVDNFNSKHNIDETDVKHGSMTSLYHILVILFGS